MGLFDFISDVASATVKIALTPIAVVKDTIDVVTGQEPEATKELIKSAGNDLEDAANKIT